MDEELDLRQYWKVIKKRWAIVVFLPIIAALTSGILSYYVLQPIYQASTTLLVGMAPNGGAAKQTGQLNYSNLQADQQLALTFQTIATSRTVEQEVIDTLNLPVKPGELDVAVSNVTNTGILKIDVEDPNPSLATQIANTLSGKFVQEVNKIEKVDNIGIVDKAVVPVQPVKPRKTLNIIIAFVVGLMVALGIAFLLEYLDNTIKDTEDIKNSLELPVLGVIPRYED